MYYIRLFLFNKTNNYIFMNINNLFSYEFFSLDDFLSSDSFFYEPNVEQFSPNEMYGDPHCLPESAEAFLPEVDESPLQESEEAYQNEKEQSFSNKNETFALLPISPGALSSQKIGKLVARTTSNINPEQMRTIYKIVVELAERIESAFENNCYYGDFSFSNDESLDEMLGKRQTWRDLQASNPHLTNPQEIKSKNLRDLCAFITKLIFQKKPLIKYLQFQAKEATGVNRMMLEEMIKIARFVNDIMKHKEHMFTQMHFCSTLKRMAGEFERLDQTMNSSRCQKIFFEVSATMNSLEAEASKLFTADSSSLNDFSEENVSVPSENSLFDPSSVKTTGSIDSSLTIVSQPSQKKRKLAVSTIPEITSEQMQAFYKTAVNFAEKMETSHQRDFFYGKFSFSPDKSVDEMLGEPTSLEKWQAAKASISRSKMKINNLTCLLNAMFQLLFKGEPDIALLKTMAADASDVNRLIINEMIQLADLFYETRRKINQDWTRKFFYFKIKKMAAEFAHV